MRVIKLGLYGCGARTNVLVDSIYKYGLVKVVCCYDIDKERSIKTANKYNAVSVNSSSELINYPEIDAFIISLFPKYHANATMEVIETGKPIFLEKPIATNLEDGKKLVKKVKEKNIILHVGFVQRYVPVFKKVKEIIQSGQLGKIIGIQHNWLSRYAPPAWMIETKNWRLDPETGGQLIYHYCHFFDLLRFWNGEFKSVVSMTNHIIYNPDSPSENEIFATIEYENGALAGLHFSEVSNRNDMIGRIEGEKLTLEYEWNENSIIKIYSKPGLRKPDEIIGPFKMDIPDDEIMNDFIKEIKGEKEVSPNIIDGFIPLKLATAIRLSAKEGRKVYLKELIEDDKSD
ncbi:MAG: Gfo/Idh/MocA family oxidoreductase [Candidatus Omnitrophica bacterium]|nr:Gfo/Idh/MocA family oxidoreductase [Candidatus Omnitrophota bacterium]MCM8802504.1 Gfo/Idh/MocA family oxidoreductase [Candidatus Omnitrophota bacterium]